MANDNMKRVGLIFDAEGNIDFKKSLSSVNSSLQENRNQFKLTKAQWDENTKASQKLKDTQDYLSKQYQDSSQKVKVLRSELSELENAENKDEIAIQKKKNALIAAETTMTNYKKGLDEVSAKVKAGTADIEEYAKKIGDFGKKTTDVGKSLSKGLTAPILAIGAGALVAWNQIDESYDNIVLKTGATGEALNDLQNSFDNVYGSMPEDSLNVSNAIGEVNTRFKLTGSELENLSTYMLKFSNVTGKDVVEATKEAQFLQGNWNLTLDETKDVLGLITKKAQDTGIGVDTLMSSVNENSYVFKEMGLSVGESVELLAEFEAAGLNSEQMMTGLKKAAVEYADKGLSMSEGLSDLVKRLQDSSTHQEAYNELVDIFGKRSAGAFAKAASEGRINLESLSGDLSSYSDVVEQTYSDTLDPMDQAKIAQNNLTLASAKLGDVIQSALGPVMQKLSEILKSLADWFENLNPNIQTTIVIIGGLVAAIGPLLIIFGAIASSISNIMLLFTSFSTASTAAGVASTTLGGTLSTLLVPITAIIATIGLLVGAFIELYNSNEQFRSSVETAVASIEEVFQSLWENILAPIFEIIKNTMNDVWENGIKPLWDNWVLFVGEISTKMMELWEAIQPIVLWFIETFGPTLVDIFNYVAEIFSNVVNTITDVAGALLSNISGIVSGIIDVFKGIIDFIVGVFTGDWSRAWAGVQGIFKGIFDALVEIVKAPLNLVIGLINGMVGGIESGVNFIIKCLNKLSFDVPDWVPVLGGEHWGFDFDNVSLGRIDYLAKGGNVLSGSAIVGEAGAELLTQKGNRTTVSPLTRGGGANPVDIIDYDKLAITLVKAFKNLSILMDGDKLGEVVDNRILKAVM